MTHAMHQQFILKIVDALGLQGQKVTRVVIDIAISNPVKVYVERLMENKEAQPFVDALKGTPVEMVDVEPQIFMLPKVKE